MFKDISLQLKRTFYFFDSRKTSYHSKEISKLEEKGALIKCRVFDGVIKEDGVFDSDGCLSVTTEMFSLC